MIQIWRDCGVGNNPWRDSIFDCDDFATSMTVSSRLHDAQLTHLPAVYKAEVSKWGNRTFKAGVRFRNTSSYFV